MSIPVDLDRLAEVLARYGFAYLVTIGDDGRPHLVAVSPVLTDGVLTVGELGRTTTRNLTARPQVTLVWPPQAAGDYSLIVDGTGVVEGTGVVDGPALRATAVRAVLHRPARTATPEEPAPPGCTADCVEL